VVAVVRRIWWISYLCRCLLNLLFLHQGNNAQIPSHLLSLRLVLVLDYKSAQRVHSKEYFQADSFWQRFHLFLHIGSVAWSVVCHIRAACRNCSTDLDAIWDPTTHCVSWRSLPPREGEIWGSNLQPKCAVPNCCCRLANTNKD